MPPIPILYINLDRATERRRHIEAQVATAFPAETYTLHRMPGVEGTGVEPFDTHISPHTRYLLSNPSKIRSEMQMDSWGAVGCYLSHVRCWDWLLAQPSDEVRHCLVLEDDVCFPEHFYSTVWMGPSVQHFLMDPFVPGQWDVVLLGHFETHGLDVHRTQDPYPWATLRNGGMFFGAHAYLLSRGGAALLRRHAFPMEIQVDAYMLVMQQLDWLKLFLIDAVYQCKGNVERGIIHRYHYTRPHRTVTPGSV